MYMKTHRLLLLTSCISLVVCSVLLGFLLTKGLWFSSLLVLIILAFLISGILRQQQSATNAVQKLISAIQFSDFSLSFKQSGKRKLDPALAESLDCSLNRFRTKAYETEEKIQYYTTLLSTIDSGLIVINDEREIEWHNKAALDEFHLPQLQQLSDLKTVLPDLPEMLLQLKPGEIKVIRLGHEGRIREIAFNSILFRIKKKQLSLISMKNIHSVLENNEIEAWQKLIRVLTHEIMNSLAPIISLSETLIERNAPDESEEATLTVTQQALQAIHRRSKGLLDFVQNYRKLTRIPTPQPTLFPVKELFSELQKLHDLKDIRYTFSCADSTLQLFADRTLIEQVLINLIRNAEEASLQAEAPQIAITATSQADSIIISVRDNGPGIVPEAIDKIFVPFFTTKPGGSGIGLSLCKQIMTIHHGNITVASQPGNGATFQLTFIET